MNNVTLEVEGAIAVLTITRPAALNALNSETLDEINASPTEIESNADIRVVILTGGPDKKGNAFKSFVSVRVFFVRRLSSYLHSNNRNGG